MGLNYKVKKIYESSQVGMAMLLVQIFATVMQLLSKVILSRGTFVFALMAYRHVIAALCVAPLAFFFERGYEKKLNWKIFFWLFLSALTGITGAMGLYYYGLGDTTAIYATNFLNLIPIVTFVFSIILRIEKLGLNRRSGKVKLMGAVLCVGGALITSLYKGKGFHIGHHHHNQHVGVSASATQHHHLRGTLLLVGSCFSYGTWFVVQVNLLQLFPSKYWSTMLTCVIACMQSTAIGLCIDGKMEAWKLAWDLQLLTIVYSGVFATAATFCLMTWAISVKGPTYPPMFNPLTLVFVAISDALLLGEVIRVGNIVGMVVIIMGLYSFLLGKTKQMKESSHYIPRSRSTPSTVTSQTTVVLSATVAPNSTSSSPTNIDVVVEGFQTNNSSKPS